MKNRFVVDLGTVDLSEKQITDINKGIEKVVTTALAENPATKKVKISPITPEIGQRLYGPGGGGTMGYAGGEPTK